MELKLFTDLIDALGKVAGGMKSIINVYNSGGTRRTTQMIRPFA